MNCTLHRAQHTADHPVYVHVDHLFPVLPDEPMHLVLMVAASNMFFSSRCTPVSLYDPP